MSKEDVAVSPASPSSEKKGDKVAKQETVPWLSLYSECDSIDYVALTFGVIGALINGWTFPLFSFVFGEVRER
jgi:hypothetical protein